MFGKYVNSNEEYSFPHFCVKSEVPLHAKKAYDRVLE
jgi:hypothetical protein